MCVYHIFKIRYLLKLYNFSFLIRIKIFLILFFQIILILYKTSNDYECEYEDVWMKPSPVQYAFVAARLLASLV